MYSLVMTYMVITESADKNMQTEYRKPDLRCSNIKAYQTAGTVFVSRQYSVPRTTAKAPLLLIVLKGKC